MPRTFAHVTPAAFRRLRGLTSGAVALSLTLLAVPGHAQSRPVTRGIRPAALSHLPDGGGLPVPTTGINVLTQHNDNIRSGVNPLETILSPASIVPPGSSQPVLTKLFSRQVDGAIYGQPLYVSDLTLTKNGQSTTHKGVVFVTTANNSIYAFDADDYLGKNAGPLWYINYNYDQAGISPVPGNDIIDLNQQPQQDIQPVIGIIGTPVIEAATSTMYVLVRTKELTQYYMHLRAIDITTGLERFDSPIDVGSSLSAPGTGSGTDGNGNVLFDTLMQNQRASLVLYPNTPASATNTLYICYGAHDYVEPYHGWVLAFDTQTLIQTGTFVTTPNATYSFNPFDPIVGGGIDMSGAGPSIDEQGNLFFAVGAGLFDADPTLSNLSDYGESVVKLGPPPVGAIGANTPPILPVMSSFTPFNYPELNAPGLDLGTGGILLLPDSQIPGHPHLLVAAGQEGKLYVLDRDNLGGWDSNPNAVIDENIVYSRRNSIGLQYGSPAYYNGFVFYHAAGDLLRAFQYNLNVTAPETVPAAYPVLQEAGFGPGTLPDAGAEFPGATPVITTNNGANPILWEIVPVQLANSNAATTALRAYDISVLKQQPVSFPPNNTVTIPVIYDSTAAGSRDLAGGYVKFTAPTVANGKIFVPCDGQLVVYGLTTPAEIPGAHYMISGPGFMQAADSQGNTIVVNPALVANRRYDFSITAVDNNGNPVKITKTLNVTLGGHSIATLKFNNQSYRTYSRFFSFGGDLGVSDGQQADILTLNVFGQNPVGFDHYSIATSRSVRDGGTIALSVSGQTSQGRPTGLPFDRLAVYDTLPDATQPISDGLGVLPFDQAGFLQAPAPAPTSTVGLAYEFQWGFGDLSQESSTPFFVAGGNAVNIPVQLHGVGKHVIIIAGNSTNPGANLIFTANFGSTATVIVNVTP